MDKYSMPPSEKAAIEALQLPFAVYRFVDKRVVTLALSDGFCAMFGYQQRFTLENVRSAIAQRGSFEMRYRLLLNGVYTPVVLRAVMVTESTGPLLVMGISLAGSPQTWEQEASQ